ncbi:MAG: hypothetical protein LBE98_00600 [Puniceicoccales bacterium]|nr:hypothetical protein [Puniceicoccales bacterium]
MPAGAISQLMGFVYNPDFKSEGQSALLKFRIGVSRYDFSSKKTVMDFFTITAFGKSAQHINSSIANGDNYICCFCDVKVSKYLSKSGVSVEHVEFIIHDFKTFFVQKSSQGDLSSNRDHSSQQDQSNSQDHSSIPQSDSRMDNPRQVFQISSQISQNSQISRDQQYSLFPNSFVSQQDPF